MKSLAELAELDQRARGAEFTALASLMLRGKDLSDALAIAEQSRGTPLRVVNVLKAAVMGGTMLDPGSSAWVDLEIINNGFVTALRNIGVFDRLLGDMRRIPLGQPGVRISSTALTGYQHIESAGKPISSIAFAGVALARLQSDCIIVVSDKLANISLPARRRSCRASYATAWPVRLAPYFWPRWSMARRRFRRSATPGERVRRRRKSAGSGADRRHESAVPDRRRRHRETLGRQDRHRRRPPVP